MLESPPGMEDTFAGGLGGHREAVEYIDNRKFKGDRYPHLYRVWIHSDKVLAETHGEVSGIFVMYRLEQLPDNARIEDYPL
jgi:hypothetical protein